ncbi:MAG: hypothetical protein ACR2M7_02925 [Bdellovibrionales bacterium]
MKKPILPILFIVVFFLSSLEAQSNPVLEEICRAREVMSECVSSATDANRAVLNMSECSDFFYQKQRNIPKKYNIKYVESFKKKGDGSKDFGTLTYKIESDNQKYKSSGSLSIDKKLYQDCNEHIALASKEMPGLMLSFSAIFEKEKLTQEDQTVLKKLVEKMKKLNRKTGKCLLQYNKDMSRLQKC